jgi:hypothetical protein
LHRAVSAESRQELDERLNQTPLLQPHGGEALADDSALDSAEHDQRQQLAGPVGTDQDNNRFPIALQGPRRLGHELVEKSRSLFVEPSHAQLLDDHPRRDGQLDAS